MGMGSYAVGSFVIGYDDLFADLLFLEETKLGSAVGWRRFEDFYKEQIMDFMEV